MHLVILVMLTHGLPCFKCYKHNCRFLVSADIEHCQRIALPVPLLFLILTGYKTILYFRENQTLLKHNYRTLYDAIKKL